jgi:hypothetical protein
MAETVQTVLAEFTKRIEGVVRAQVQAEVAREVRRALEEVAGSMGRTGRARGIHRLGSKAGGRRTVAELEQQMEALLKHVAANPGKRAEELAVVAGATTAELAPLLRRLVAAKRLKRKGVARGTTYAAL